MHIYEVKESAFSKKEVTVIKPQIMILSFKGQPIRYVLLKKKKDLSIKQYIPEDLNSEGYASSQGRDSARTSIDYLRDPSHLIYSENTTPKVTQPIYY